MKEIVLSIYRYLKKIKMQIIWHKEMVCLINDVKPQYSMPTINKEQFLLLIPHSDDEFIGSYTILSDLSSDVTLFNCNMPGGDSDTIHIIRRAEMEKIAQLYNRKIYSANNNKYSDLSNVIDVVKPSVILVPYFIDWHEEHLLVNELLYNALSEFDYSGLKIAMYQVTVPIKQSNINAVNPLNIGTWNMKWKLFRKTYKTQIRFPWYRVACNERINGQAYGYYAAEVFCLMDIEDWKENFSKYRPNHKYMNKIKNSLFSLKSIRRIEQPTFIKNGSNS